MITLAEASTSRESAKVSGLGHYFTGKPCIRGHSALRWTRNGECTACAEVRRAEPTKREAALSRAREAYADRKDAVLDRQRQAKLRNPERFKANAAAYCQRHPERRKKSANTYYLKNRGKYLQYGRARELGVKQATPSWADQKAIEAIYRQAKTLTDETGSDHHVDHCIPLKGVNGAGERVVCGLHVHQNLAAIPASVNRAKSNKFEAGQC